MAKNDPNKWINGITFEIAPAKVLDHQKVDPPLARLYATNGQVMFVHRVQPLGVTGYNGTPTSIIIPAPFVEKVLKSALPAAKAIARDQADLPSDKKTEHVVTLRFAEGTVELTNTPSRPDPKSLRKITARHAGTSQTITPVEDTLDLSSQLEASELYAPASDHSQKIPAALDGQAAYYSQQHLQTIARAHELVNADPRIEFRGVSQNGQEPGMAWIDDRTIALVMPVRPYQVPEKQVPDWATSSLEPAFWNFDQKTASSHETEAVGEIHIARDTYIHEKEDAQA